jgi:hypothetical protein
LQQPPGKPAGLVSLVEQAQKVSVRCSWGLRPEQMVAAASASARTLRPPDLPASLAALTRSPRFRQV